MHSVCLYVKIKEIRKKRIKSAIFVEIRVHKASVKNSLLLEVAYDPYHDKPQWKRP
jgi:hypothetical protein